MLRKWRRDAVFMGGKKKPLFLGQILSFKVKNSFKYNFN